MDNYTPRVLGVIPARGGSKRLNRKNIRVLYGHPLIAYTIKAAQKATLLTDYLVSSEDEEILEVARSYGAPVPFVRPAHLATDKARNIEVILHALDYMEDKTNQPYDIVILLQPTCPIRNPEHIDDAVRLLSGSELETVASVKGPYKKRDPILKRIRDGVLEAYCGKEDSGNIEPFYLYNASIYGARRDYFVRERKMISEKQVPLVMDQVHSIDIDTEVDFIVAAAYLKQIASLKEKTKESTNETIAGGHSGIDNTY
jgi:CMP-N-acetylneuraminic acid synthetase